MEFVTIKTLAPLVKSSPLSCPHDAYNLRIMSVCFCRQPPLKKKIKRQQKTRHIAEYRVVPVCALDLCHLINDT